MSTQTSDPAVGLDPAAAEEWILALGLGAEPPLRLAPVGRGKSNLTFVVIRQERLVAFEAGL